jgi:hypothetical protein
MCTYSKKTYQIYYSLQRLKKPLLKYCLASYTRIRNTQENYWSHEEIMGIQSFETMKIIQNCKISKPTTISSKRHNSEDTDVSIWQEYRGQEHTDSN